MYKCKYLTSRVVYAVPGQLTSVCDRFLKHLLGKLIIVFELQGFMVETYGFV